MEDCLRTLLVNDGIVILPVHDELLCPLDKVDAVKEQMIKSYRRILERALRENGKLNDDEPLPDNLNPVIKQS